VSPLRRLRRRAVEPARTSFRRIAERELAFLERDHGFATPKWEPYPHAEEVLTYERDATQIRVHLGDSAKGIDVELLSADGSVEHLQINEWIQNDDRPWTDETERILATYAQLLRTRASGFDGAVSSG
jgi:hypothetical protein